MARFRLKFLLQEFDLVGPEVLMGRSPECHVTLEDPLVSRQHARILIGGDTAQIMDLGSRNGTRINGQLIEGAALLHDGDRVRLGTQELLFYMVDRAPREAKTTGFMTMCRACKTPFPDTAKECPHCGTPAIAEDETFSGFAVEPSRTRAARRLIRYQLHGIASSPGCVKQDGRSCASQLRKPLR